MKLLDCLSKEDLNKVSYIELKKDQILFLENEECKYVGIVLPGSISISSFSYSGKEIIYYFINDYGIFGNNLIFSSFPYYKGNVIAKKDSKICLISKANLLSLLKNNTTFLETYMSISSNETKALNDKIKILSFDDAYDRFMYYLHINKNEITFASITNLADILNLRRETLSRLLSKLKNNNIIEIKGKKISLIES